LSAILTDIFITFLTLPVRLVGNALKQETPRIFKTLPTDAAVGKPFRSDSASERNGCYQYRKQHGTSWRLLPLQSSLLYSF
jgi:hypothetical protein